MNKKNYVFLQFLYVYMSFQQWTPLLVQYIWLQHELLKITAISFMQRINPVASLNGLTWDNKPSLLGTEQRECLINMIIHGFQTNKEN